MNASCRVLTVGWKEKEIRSDYTCNEDPVFKWLRIKPLSEARDVCYGSCKLTRQN